MNNAGMTIKTVAALVIGNALEWYDFIVYSFMTVYIAKLFFPAIDATNSLLLTTATFGAAFFMRPVGGILIGICADKKGRKAAITLIITLMTVATLLIACAPVYAQIGIAAPIIIVFARLLQGFSAGGEFGTSTALLVELAPPAQRGFYASWQMVGQTLAMVLGSVVGMLLTNILSEQQILAWGWRVPFIAGLILFPIGIYIRRQLNAAHTMKPETIIKTKFVQEIRQHGKQILIAMSVVIGGTVPTYINFLYMPTYAHVYLHLPMSAAYMVCALGMCLSMLLIPLFGKLSDRIGRKPIMLSSITTYLLLAYPLFIWLNTSPTITTLIITHLVFCALLGAYFGVFAVILAELFPRGIRSTGLSISYNFAVMLFGGFAQFVVTWLIRELNTPLAVVYYLMIGVAISVVAALCYKEKGTENEYAGMVVAPHRV